MDEAGLVLVLLMLVLALVVAPIVALVLLLGLRRDVRELLRRQDQVTAAAGRVTSTAPESGNTTPSKRVEVVAAVPAQAPAAPVPPPLPSPPLPPPVRAQPELPLTLPPVAAPRTESPLVTTARGVLRRMWNWILVGDERRDGMTIEFAIASTWLLRLGIVAIVACIAYFLKWSMENGLVSDLGRVLISVLAGLGMIVWGMRLLGRKYHLIGQGLLGGGLLALYFSVYAAGPLYGIIGTPLSFGLLVLVTLTAGVLSTRIDSLLIAILALAGGYVTPLLLPAEGRHLAVLYSYMLLLSLGILGIAQRKQWRLLNYLGFTLTYVLFFVSMGAYEVRDFPLAMAFLCAFFVIHSSLAYLHNVVRRNASTALEILHLSANAVLFSGTAYVLIRDAYGRPYPAVMSVLLAAFYAVHVFALLRRRLDDRRLLTALIALAGVFTTWTLPLMMEKESLTIALALLALMFVWMGRRVSSHFMENLGHALFGVVLFRLLVWDMPRNFGGGAPAITGWTAYRQSLWGRLWVFGVPIACTIAAFFVQREPRRGGALRVVEGSDTRPLIPPRVITGAFYWGAVGLVFLFFQREFNLLFGLFDPLRLPVLTLLWCALGAWFLWRLLADGGGRVLSVCLGAAMLVALGKLVFLDFGAWRLGEDLVYGVAYSAPYVCGRLLDFGAILAVALAAWAALRGRAAGRGLAPVFGYGGLALLCVYLTIEVNTLLHWALPGFRAGGVSVLWAILAIGFTTGGIWRDVRPLRYVGLGLFGVVVAKVFFRDLAEMAVVFRVIAFMIVGVALMLGSFAYLFASRTRAGDGGEAPDERRAS